MTDFGTVTVDQVIMHRVPRARRGADDAEPIELSEAPIELREQDKGYLQLRLRDTLGGYARPVQEDTDEDSPTPDLVRALLGGSGGDLVTASQTIATRLREVQPGISPDGLVMVVLGEIDDEPCIVIAKVEHEQGMRVEQTTNEAGLRTYRAEFLRDLIFGQGTKVFKVGIFARSGVAGSLLTGHVVDSQQNANGVADFFLGKVLGCTFVERADVLTERFFTAAQRWVNRSVKDPERAANYEIALLAEMQSGARRLSVRRFASQHLAADDQDGFVAVMTEASVPTREFAKDVALVAPKIRRMKVQTRRNATVLVPPDMYEDGSFAIAKTDTEVSEITLRDEVRSVSGASGPRPAEQ